MADLFMLHPNMRVSHCKDVNSINLKRIKEQSTEAASQYESLKRQESRDTRTDKCMKYQRVASDYYETQYQYLSIYLEINEIGSKYFCKAELTPEDEKTGLDLTAEKMGEFKQLEQRIKKLESEKLKLESDLGIKRKPSRGSTSLSSIIEDS